MLPEEKTSGIFAILLENKRFLIIRFAQGYSCDYGFKLFCNLQSEAIRLASNLCKQDD